MPDLSSSKIIEHRFHVDSNKGELGIGYYMIIGRDLMVQLGLSAEFKRQVLQCYDVTVPMKEPRSLLGKSGLTSCEMREVLMQNSETASTRKYTKILVKVLDITYAKA